MNDPVSVFIRLSVCPDSGDKVRAVALDVRFVIHALHQRQGQIPSFLCTQLNPYTWMGRVTRRCCYQSSQRCFSFHSLSPSKKNGRKRASHRPDQVLSCTFRSPGFHYHCSCKTILHSASSPDIYVCIRIRYSPIPDVINAGRVCRPPARPLCTIPSFPGTWTGHRDIVPPPSV